MDPALRKQREDFKRHAMAVPVVEKKAQKPAEPPKPKPKRKKRASKPKPVPVTATKQATHLSSNPYRILKAVVDMMRLRYTSRNYESLTLDEILKAINLTDLKTDTRQWVLQALKENVKITYYREGEHFLFQPSIGPDVRNRRQLLAKLAEYEKEGLGGIPMSEVKEALHKPEKAVKRLEDEGKILIITRQDKEDILFYNNREFEIEIDEEFRSLWRGINTDGLAEGDIEKYLQNVGLGAMQGQTRKRMAPSSQQKTRKKPRMQKVLNTHLESGLLKDYSEGVSRPPE